MSVIIYAGTLIWWSAKFENRVDNNASAIARNGLELAEISRDVDELSDAISAQAVTNGRIDVKLANIERVLEQIARSLEARDR